MSNNRRYYVTLKSGRKFCIEEYGPGYSNWGDINPATKKLERVHSKVDEVIDDSNTQITKDKYKNICLLDAGTSPFGYIDALDSFGIERIESEFIKYIN